MTTEVWIINGRCISCIENDYCPSACGCWCHDWCSVCRSEDCLCDPEDWDDA